MEWLCPFLNELTAAGESADVCRVAQQCSQHFGRMRKKNNESSSHCGEHGQVGHPKIRSAERIANPPGGSRRQHSLWEGVNSSLTKM
jgi:hypothetical protein